MWIKRVVVADDEGIQRNVLAVILRKLLPEAEVIACANGQGANKREHKYAFLLPGMEEEEVLSRLSHAAQELKGRGIFWAGISNWQEDLIERLPEASRQADEVLAFCFYKPNETGIFTYRELGAILERPMPSCAVYEKELREAVRNGRKKMMEETLERLKKELGEGPLYYPNRVKYRISSVTVSLVREVEGMIPQKEYDLLLNESYERYGQKKSVRKKNTRQPDRVGICPARGGRIFYL